MVVRALFVGGLFGYWRPMPEIFLPSFNPVFSHNNNSPVSVAGETFGQNKTRPDKKYPIRTNLAIVNCERIYSKKKYFNGC